jgi:CxxC-x17-CxxC domain-containing protein
MKNFKKSGGFGDRSRKPSFNSFNNSSDNKQLHDAKCNKCGVMCQVPFRPNGKKPIYCNNCFGESRDDQSSQPRFSDRNDRNDRNNRFEKKDFGQKPRFEKSFDRPVRAEAPRPDRRIDDLQVQVQSLHSKVDFLVQQFEKMNRASAVAPLSDKVAVTESKVSKKSEEKNSAQPEAPKAKKVVAKKTTTKKVTKKK